MYCPKCGVGNPDKAQSCGSCGSPLPPASAPPPSPISKTSGLAIAALVLGILTPFTCGLTAIPAMVLGIIGLVGIERSGGRLTGRGFAIGGIVVPVVVLPILLIVLILMPALSRTRQAAFRTVCATNLSGIGKAMLIYSNDYEDEFPRAGWANTSWGPEIAAWDASDRMSAFGDVTGNATISSSLYLLVKYTEVTPKTFVCKGDVGATEFKLEDYPNRNASCQELIDAWDFGGLPGRHPTTHCSYSYHQPYGSYPLTNSFLPGMAVAADRNPFIKSPAADAQDFAGFVPDLPPAHNGSAKQARISNAIVHQRDGQNVLFMDSHVAFEKRAFCGIENDNIYTYVPPSSGLPANPVGERPIVYDSGPGTKKDSYLVHDDPTARGVPGHRSRGR